MKRACLAPACLAPVFLVALAMGCGEEPQDGGLRALAAYEISAVAGDDNLRDGAVSRTLGFLFADHRLAEDTPETCGSLRGAVVRFNGTMIQPELLGGWGRGGPLVRAACGSPSIHLSLEAATSDPMDAVLEIEGDGTRFVIAVPGAFVRRELELVSLDEKEAVLRPTPPLEGRTDAWLRGADPSVRSVPLPTRLENGDLHVSLEGAPRGDQPLNASIDATPQVARCGGWASCRALVSIFRKRNILIP